LLGIPACSDHVVPGVECCDDFGGEAVVKIVVVSVVVLSDQLLALIEPEVGVGSVFFA
jgi:hypothetical protein